MSKEKIAGGLIGMIAGIVTGILIAPKAGKELREDIKNKYSDIRDEIMKKVSSTKEVTKKNYDGIIEEVISAYEANKRLTKTEATEIKRKLKEAYDNISSTLKEK